MTARGWVARLGGIGLAMLVTGVLLPAAANARTDAISAPTADSQVTSADRYVAAFLEGAGGPARAPAQATPTASPAAPKTGQAGLVEESSNSGAAIVFVAIAVAVVAGGRLLTSRDR